MWSWPRPAKGVPAANIGTVKLAMTSGPHQSNSNPASADQGLNK